MDSKISIKEIIFLLGMIVSFAWTGLLIMFGYAGYALIMLSVTAAFVLAEFCTVLSDGSSSVMDFTGSRIKSTRKKSSSKAMNRYKSTLKTDVSRIKKQSNIYIDDVDEVDDDFNNGNFEGVGNFKVYKRGEKIKLNNSDKED